MMLNGSNQAGLGMLHSATEVSRWKKGRSIMTCTAIIKETHDVKSFRLEQDVGTLFLFKPGDSVVLEFAARGKRVFRNYTIASSPSKPHSIILTVKRDPRGLVSRWLHDHFVVGEKLSVSGPAGMFNCVDIPAEKMLMLSGGSGITPVMSMSRWLCDATAGSHDIRFVHSARTPADIIYRNELEFMDRQFGGFAYDAICESPGGEAGWDGATGFLTSDLLTSLAPDFLERTVYCCGPTPYMDTVKNILVEADFDMARYHEESFTEGRAAIDAVDPITPDELSVFSPGDALPASGTPKQALAEGVPVSFASSGVEGVCQPGMTILEFAHALGVAVPTSCCMGLCGTCKTRVLEGKVDLPEREGLTDKELAEGYTLVCVAQPVGAVRVEL